MNLEAIRIALVQRRLRLKDLATQTGISYDRLLKILHEYRPARKEEVQAVALALDLPEAVIAPAQGKDQ